jgi:hypothetical protein
MKVFERQKGFWSKTAQQSVSRNGSWLRRWDERQPQAGGAALQGVEFPLAEFLFVFPFG